MQMNFQREKTSNALEWQRVIELCAEVTVGIRSSWVGLDGTLHKSVCLNPIYILFHIIFYWHIFFILIWLIYLIFSLKSYPLLIVNLKFESEKGEMIMQQPKIIIKDSQIPLASPHLFAINDVTARCSPKLLRMHKLLLFFQAKLVFACWPSNISCTNC